MPLVYLRGKYWETSKLTGKNLFAKLDEIVTLCETCETGAFTKVHS